MNKSSQKEECCAECSTPASGAPDETQKECLNKDCKYCHMYSINTEQTIREEERAKCRGLMEDVKKKDTGHGEGDDYEAGYNQAIKEVVELGENFINQLKQ